MRVGLVGSTRRPIRASRRRGPAGLRRAGSRDPAHDSRRGRGATLPAGRPGTVPSRTSATARRPSSPGSRAPWTESGATAPGPCGSASAARSSTVDRQPPGVRRAGASGATTPAHRQHRFPDGQAPPGPDAVIPGHHEARNATPRVRNPTGVRTGSTAVGLIGRRACRPRDAGTGSPPADRWEAPGPHRDHPGIGAARTVGVPRDKPDRVVRRRTDVSTAATPQPSTPRPAGPPPVRAPDPGALP